MIPQLHPNLLKICFKIDEYVSALPVDQIFEKSQNLSELQVSFDLPRCVLESGSESRLPTPHDKRMITLPTYTRLKKLTLILNTEPLFMCWIDMYMLFIDAVNLEHLEVVRNVKFRTISSQQSRLFKVLPDSHYYPLGLKGRIKLTKLRTLIVKNYLSMYMIIDLIQLNKNLTYLKLNRKSFNQQLILSDTLFLERIDVKLDQKASLILGENLSLKQIKTNCKLELNSKLPHLEKLIYLNGYKPSKIESQQLSLFAYTLKNIVCEKRQNLEEDVPVNTFQQNLLKKDDDWVLLDEMGWLPESHHISQLSNIQQLQFSNSKCTNLIINTRSLKSLKLYKMDELQQIQFKNARNLNYLELQAIQIKKIKFKSQNLRNLFELQLDVGNIENNLELFLELTKLKSIRKIIYKGNFYQQQQTKKKLRISISSKSLEVIRLIQYANEKSNLSIIRFKECPKLFEVGLENFKELKLFQLLDNTNLIQNIFLKNIGEYFRTLQINNSFNLRNFELFCESHLQLNEITDSSQDYYKYQFWDENVHPSELRNFKPSSNLKYFKYLITFHNGFPTKAGMKWKSGQSQVYFRNQNQGKERSLDLTRRLFPFLHKIMHEDLYINGYGVPVEKQASDQFQSKRGGMFKKIKNNGKMYKNTKESIKEKEIYPREGVDTFNYEAQLYMNQDELDYQ
ncbi:hypothetical protein OXYTRIMIC_456 [Oxytricha trifallax]|uniref:Uncharacterized protein n=1 Tax=Oxytricha trifallax TaxID=1172189 RepID=A0A073HZC3_9SPIT|nr:hypothetical protein OXYTRIMIC_456 [Oxytricha trifallax]